MQCERHKVSQGNCRRPGTVNRITSRGTLVKLCAQCDAKIGDTVSGIKKLPAPAHTKPNRGTVPSWNWEI